MINWSIVPMVYNDSFTYMEWLGKLTYIVANHEDRIDDCEKNIIDLWEKIKDHNERIDTLETWRADVVDPFIKVTTNTLANHERRITAAEDDIDALQNWKRSTVDPFITEITDWKDNTIDPFVVNITTWKDDVVDPHITGINTWRNDTVDPFITQATQDIAKTKNNLTAEASARKNADNALSERIVSVETIAKSAYNTAQRIEVVEKNVGTVRYFLDTTTVSQTGSNTSLSVVLPDKDWVTVDVRFGLIINSTIQEFRLSYVNNGQTTQIQLTQNNIDFLLNYEPNTRTITATAINTTITAADIYRFDYILYKGALTQAAQDQADIDFFNKMDIDGNGVINACEAVWTLSFYADVSNSVIPSQYTGQEAWTWWVNNIHPDSHLNPNSFPDFNGNGCVDAIDANWLLSYYSWVSTTNPQGLTGPQLMKMFRTQSLNN